MTFNVLLCSLHGTCPSSSSQIQWPPIQAVKQGPGSARYSIFSQLPKGERRELQKILVSTLSNSNQPHSLFSFQTEEMYFVFRKPSSSDLVIDDMYSKHMLQVWLLEILPPNKGNQYKVIRSQQPGPCGHRGQQVDTSQELLWVMFLGIISALDETGR